MATVLNPPVAPPDVPVAPTLRPRLPLAWEMLRAALAAALVVGVNTGAVAAIATGRRGLLGAAIGLVIVIAFSAPGLVILHLTRHLSAQGQMAAALLSYTCRVALFGGILAICLTWDGFDRFANPTVVGIAAMVDVLAWTAGEIWGYQHARIPTYDLDQPSTSPHSSDEPGELS